MRRGDGGGRGRASCRARGCSNGARRGARRGRRHSRHHSGLRGAGRLPSDSSTSTATSTSSSSSSRTATRLLLEQELLRSGAHVAAAARERGLAVGAQEAQLHELSDRLWRGASHRRRRRRRRAARVLRRLPVRGACVVVDVVVSAVSCRAPLPAWRQRGLRVLPGCGGGVRGASWRGCSTNGRAHWLRVATAATAATAPLQQDVRGRGDIAVCTRQGGLRLRAAEAKVDQATSGARGPRARGRGGGYAAAAAVTAVTLLSCAAAASPGEPPPWLRCPVGL
mmetsp:Transcript_14722/g.38295  ORF Transcript_14722/g.38295 Transcript_14722/m.38295 type:complete len:281 (+) Transcript_14722:391-1233(+)